MEYSQLNDELYLQMFDALPDAVYLVIPVFAEGEQTETIADFEFTYSNKAADQLSGCLDEKLMGKRLIKSKIFDPPTRKQAFEQFHEVWTTGAKKEFTYFNSAVGRSLDILRCKFHDGVLNMLRDRTDQRLAERKEQEQKELLDAVVKNSPNGIMVFSAVRDKDVIVDYKVTLWNEVGARLVSFSEEDLREMTLNKMIALRGESAIHQNWKKVVETGESFESEYYSEVLKRWLHITAVKMGDGFMTTYSDITHLKEFQQTIERSANRLNTIINSSHVGIFTLTPVKESDTIVDFRFGIVNPAVAAYIGQTAETLQNDLGSKWFPAYKTNGLFDIYVDTYINNKSHHFDIHYEDGYDVYFDILTIKADDEILVTFNDQTDIKKLQLQLEKSVDELKQSNRNLEEFAYVASHDLQEPLRKINFFSDRLKTILGEARYDESEKMLERIQSSSKRMQTLIEDLLTYSSISIKKKSFEDVSLAEITTQVLNDLDTIAAEKNASFKIEELPVIKGDKQQLVQLFDNLISNSLKYSKPDVPPEVKISCTKVEGSSRPLGIEKLEGSFYLIEVADNGIGFEQQYAQRIFQVFQRLHGKQEYPGTGVGLAIADKVVTNHHGYIIAESEPGMGSVFKILFPMP